MGQCRIQRINVCFVVFLSAVLLVGLEQAHASWVSSSNADFFSALSRSQTIDGGRALMHEETRRILASSGYYIGYGALSADHVPCPPQSGRSYYTPNCDSATGPVQPYTRGCTAISRCARGSS